MMIWLLLASAEAEVTTNLDVKTFFVTVHPFEHVLMPPSDTAQGFVDMRGRLQWEFLDNLSVEVHHVVTSGTPQYQTQLQLDLAEMGVELEEGMASNLMTGVGLQAPEAVDLSWSMDDTDLFLQGRTDRLFLQTSFGNHTLRVGRQAISFGHGMVFNPMDLVQPFSIATIDNEYKAGIDAVRLDSYFGMTGQVTGVIAYAGSWDRDGLTAVLNAQGTIGLTDISVFAGSVRSDVVLGTGLVSSVGAVGLHSDVTLTLPETDEDPFIRVTTGALWRPFSSSSVTMEYYYQSLGASDASGYLDFASSDRYARGELWVMGQHYATIGWGQELTALSMLNAAFIANLKDASMMVSPSLSVSVSDNVQMVAGGYVGVGERPNATSTTEILLNSKALELNSEFGLMPGSGFIQVRSYY